ncbi:hypothetical protein [Thalassolituus marinus]|uniref:Uncharacterized protein n=1 Tax=Thalassolituus marinus TaxID=671053 RepID=A0ABS7ZUU3_9GAMM|nr:hypothetical protein [Thalassolituus marinus]MCA6065352.1 hypothetical protein [Thalassolituus marinus]
MEILSFFIRDRLVKIGRNIRHNDLPDVEIVSSFSGYDSINRAGGLFWEKTCSDLSDDDLISLIYGVSYLETFHRWIGGSAASCIFIFRLLIKRNISIEVIDNVSEWIIRNSYNHYNPLGSRVRLGARNYSEYLELSKKRAIKKAERERIEKIRQEKYAREREIRRVMAEACNNDRKSSIRLEIIKEMEALSLVDKLIFISGQPMYPPQFFPTCIADSCRLDDLMLLSPEVRSNLAARLRGRRKGPWGKFRTRLRECREKCGDFLLTSETDNSLFA